MMLLGWAVATSSAQEPAAKPAPSASREELLKQTQPGAEHERMAKYAGEWAASASMGNRSSVGSARARMITGGRFLHIEYTLTGAAGPIEGSFLIGFDRRHGHYELLATDTFGTYWVASRGKSEAEGGKIKLAGRDDDPTMKALGFTKEFVHVLDFRRPDEWGIEVRFIDTRTPERREIQAMEYRFQRKP